MPLLATWLASRGAEVIEQDILEYLWGFILNLTGLAASMAVNTLSTGLIVFRILKVFLEYRPTSVERTLGSTRGNIPHHVLFIIIESGMVLFAIQLVRVVITSLIAMDSDPAENLIDGSQIVIGLHQMLNVITRPVHIYFCFTDKTYLFRA